MTSSGRASLLIAGDVLDGETGGIIPIRGKFEISQSDKRIDFSFENQYQLSGTYKKTAEGIIKSIDVPARHGLFRRIEAGEAEKMSATE